MSGPYSDAPTDRAGHILRALIVDYIKGGQPVGSRTLSKHTGLTLSSATIRNVMSDLEELGFIISPHTSAGRIPTAKGYRFFVDTLVKLQPPAVAEVSRIQHTLADDASGDAKTIAEAASTALSSLTNLAGVVTIPKQTHSTLRQIEFLPLSDRKVLAILVLNDREVENRILQMNRDYGSDELQRAANYLNASFAGKDLGEVRTHILSELGNTRESMNQLMIDAVNIAQKAFEMDVTNNGFVISGETQLMGFEELSNMDKLKQLFEAFNQQQDILHLLDRSMSTDGVQIFIGEESGYSILDECSVVAAPYRVDDETVGVLGVIGPTRMAYQRVIPIVDITAKLVGSALNSNQ